MEETVKQRLVRFINSKQMSVREFERSISVSNGYVKGISKGLGVEILRRITDIYPTLNEEWLLYGEGEMLNPSAPINSHSSLSDPIQPYHTTPRPIPYYTVDFEGGFDIMVNDQTATPERLVTFPNQPQRATCCCHITGHSMEPELNNGDIIVLERIDDFSWLPLGEIYAIVTTNGMRTVKRLMRSTDETCYRLQPANTNYPDQDIPKNILQHVFRVVGSYKNL